MPEPVDPRFREPVEGFLRGNLSVLDFSYAYRAVVNQVAERRPLQGLEVDAF